MHFNSLTVAICTFNRTQYALQTVEEVLKQKTHTPAEVEILVIDQTPEVEILQQLREQIDKLNASGLCRWIFSTELGLTRARNRAIQEISTEIIVFIDDDVLLPEGYLNAQVAVFNAHSEIYGIAGPVYHRRMREASVEMLSIETPDVGTAEHFGNRNPGQFQPGWKDIMVGCNQAIRRSKAIEATGYDEGVVGGYCEDEEFTNRLNKCFPGCIAFNPDSWLVHLRAPSGGCRLNQNSAHSEAQKVSGFHIFMFRHARGWQRWDFFARSLRIGPLRKENLRELKRWCPAWLGFFSSLRDAWKYRDRVRSPFIDVRKTEN